MDLADVKYIKKYETIIENSEYIYITCNIEDLTK
jgi:hypothetical protein